MKGVSVRRACCVLRPLLVLCVIEPGSVPLPETRLMDVSRGGAFVTCDYVSFKHG